MVVFVWLDMVIMITIIVYAAIHGHMEMHNATEMNASQMNQNSLTSRFINIIRHACIITEIVTKF